MTIAFDNSYARLPERFFAPTLPTPVQAPRLIRLNHELAAELGLDAEWLASDEGVQVLAGNRIAEGSAPLAAAYAGHQFGQFVPQLGDGRALLLGEIIDRAGLRRDIQLKGSGPTRFSRGGDGRAPLGPVLREYIVSEAMMALGIPTTRSLAAVQSGETVVRDRFLPGGVLTRVASSHIRIGTFQFFAARRDLEAVTLLADHVIARHYPQAASAAEPYRALLDGVIQAQARLVAQWLLVGFIHGVLNTDNMSVAGETLDYGPCAFLDAYDPAAVLSSVDQFGRYAFGNQPTIVLWNLTRLAETLVPLLADGTDEAVAIAQDALAAFAPSFQAAFRAGLGRKLGLSGDSDADAVLGQDLLDLMAAGAVDFTLGFRRLGDGLADPSRLGEVRSLFRNAPAFDAWLERWRARIGDAKASATTMRTANPIYIPRNHLVEAALAAAIDRQDFGPFEELLHVLSQPFAEQERFARFARPPALDEQVLRTFCGT